MCRRAGDHLDRALSAGHGALHLAFVTETPARLVLLLILVKSLASMVSVASGFRGGLFFASLLIGALGGKFFAALVALAAPPGPDPLLMALVGMSAFGAAVIGAPLAMTFLALETTGSLEVTGLVLAAVAVAGLIVRRLFGYSFATWRFHLRGESIRGAHDIGWINDLTAGRLMRRDPRSVPATMDLAGFRSAVPLGSATQVVLLDGTGRYAGIVAVAEAHAAPPETATLADLARHRDRVLLPRTNARDAMAIFEAAEAEALAVVDGPARRVLGLLTEGASAAPLRRGGGEAPARGDGDRAGLRVCGRTPSAPGSGWDEARPGRRYSPRAPLLFFRVGMRRAAGAQPTKSKGGVSGRECLFLPNLAGFTSPA